MESTDSEITFGIDPGDKIGVAATVPEARRQALTAFTAFDSDRDKERTLVEWVRFVMVMRGRFKARIFIESVFDAQGNPKVIGRAELGHAMTSGLLRAERVVRTLEYEFARVFPSVPIVRVSARKTRGAIIGAENANDPRIRATLAQAGYEADAKRLIASAQQHKAKAFGPDERALVSMRGLSAHTRDALVAALFGAQQARLAKARTR